MSTSVSEFCTPLATNVTVTETTLCVELSDGRTITVPLSWYPRHENGTLAERGKWELTGNGHGIHWPEIDEDISVKGLIAGKRSAESRASLREWLNSRRGGD